MEEFASRMIRVVDDEAIPPGGKTLGQIAKGAELW